MPNLNTGVLAALPVVHPGIREQQAIAEVLGTLDDKIDLNQRMSQKLEAFIGARFQLLTADTADWDQIPIGDAVKVRGGGTPSTTETRYWSGGIHAWATPKDLSRLHSPALLATERSVTDEGLSRISSGLLPEGTVLLSSRAPIGYLAIAELPMAINQGLIAMVCDGPLPNYYVWQWTAANMEAIKARANGSTFQEISKASFRPIQVAIPPEDALTTFTTIVGALYRLIVAKVSESETLISLRDTLLPDLVCGRLRVKDAENAIRTVV